MSNRLKVLTINIWNRNGPSDRRFPMLREGIQKLAPDVIGMQEVMSDGEADLATEIAAGLGYEIVYGEAKMLMAGISLGNAILSRHPITEHERFELPDAGTDERRSLLLSEIATPYGALPFACTHLAWKFHHGHVRERQVMAIRDIFKENLPVRGDALPPVLVGDFNAVPSATEVRFLTGLHSLDGKSMYLADCFAQVGEGPGFTYDEERNPFAAQYHEAPRRIDYIFVRGPDTQGRGKPLACRVVLDEVVDGVAPSDHFGVYAELRT
jgi:endonuclease/exonuclease/phosphatase family metal-dependent hydrolase